MDTTVRIEDVEYILCEVIQAGEYWGIRTPQKTFWVFPACDDEGHEIKSLPPFLPCEIRAVTVNTPDLTRDHPETVREFFDKRGSYFRTATLQAYVNQYPNERWLTEEQFQKARHEVLNESLEEFARDSRARLMVWNRHGTMELANRVGYLGDVWEIETLEDGTERRFSTKASVAMGLFYKLIEVRKIDEDEAQAVVDGLKYVMIYDGVPTQHFIYLNEMKVVASSLAPETLKLNLQAKIESHVRYQIQLSWPEGEACLREINANTQQTLTKVAEIHEKTQAKGKKWHQKGGRATSKWIGHEHDRDTLLLPDVLLEDYSTPADIVLKPIFDAFWQSAGFPNCQHYNAAGRGDMRTNY